MISLKKIATICGVSIGTVSKALRDKPGVRPDVRERVRSVAEKHNYHPNRLVHAIRHGRSMSVGILCSSFGEEFSGCIMEGILETLISQQYDSLVTSWDYHVHEGDRVLRSFAERRVDGILMFPPAVYPSSTYLDELQSFQNPIVAIDQSWPGCTFDLVGSQDTEGAFAITEHLIEQGHRQIANIHFSHSSTGAARLLGFQQAMIRHGVAVHERWLREIREYNTGESHTIATELLSAHNRPTAIVAFNDIVALQVLAAASDLGLRIPEDLSVAGFADLTIAHHIRPRLTTIAQNPKEIGRRAATRLLAHITGKPKKKSARPSEERIPVELKIRGSTGPCKK